MILAAFLEPILKIPQILFTTFNKDNLVSMEECVNSRIIHVWIAASILKIVATSLKRKMKCEAIALMQSMQNVGSIYDTFCSSSHATVFRPKIQNIFTPLGVNCYGCSCYEKILHKNVSIVNSNLLKYLEKTFAFLTRE